MDQSEFQIRIQSRESFLLANDGQFLGKLSLNNFDPESISNEYSFYGNKYSAYSIFNQYGQYGSPYSSLSPNNAYTSTPPVIYLRGVLVAYLTKNRYLSTNTVDPSQLFIWLRENGLDY